MIYAHAAPAVCAFSWIGLQIAVGRRVLAPQCPWFALPTSGVPAQSQVSMHPGIWGLERAQEGHEVGLFLGGEPNVETVVVEGDHVVERGG